MNRITIMASDKCIGVDGIFVEFDFDIDPTIHAVQWDGNRGEIEYKSKIEPNKKISSFEEFEHLLVARDNAIATQEQREIDEQAAVEAARTPQDKRRAEYPPIHEQLEALYDARQGDNTKLENIDARIQGIKSKYPLQVTQP